MSDFQAAQEILKITGGNCRLELVHFPPITEQELKFVVKTF